MAADTTIYPSSLHRDVVRAYQLQGAAAGLAKLSEAFGSSGNSIQIRDASDAVKVDANLAASAWSVSSNRLTIPVPRGTLNTMLALDLASGQSKLRVGKADGSAYVEARVNLTGTADRFMFADTNPTLTYDLVLGTIQFGYDNPPTVIDPPVVTGDDPPQALRTAQATVDSMTRLNSGRLYGLTVGNQFGFNDPRSRGKNVIGASLTHGIIPDGNDPGSTDARIARYLGRWWTAGDTGDGPVGSVPTTNLNGSDNSALDIVFDHMYGRIRAGYAGAGSWEIITTDSTGQTSCGLIPADYTTWLDAAPQTRQLPNGRSIYRVPRGSGLVQHGGVNHQPNAGNGWFQDATSKVRGNANWNGGAGVGVIDYESRYDCLAWGAWHRNVRWSDSLPDDRGAARVTLHVGADPYLTMPTQVPGFVSPIALAALVEITPDWQWTGVVTIREANDLYYNNDHPHVGIPAADFLANPPPGYL